MVVVKIADLRQGESPFKARECLYQAEQVMIHQKLTNFRAAYLLTLSRLYAQLGEEQDPAFGLHTNAKSGLAALSMSYCTMALSVKDAPIDDLVIAHCSIAYQVGH